MSDFGVESNYVGISKETEERAVEMIEGGASQGETMRELDIAESTITRICAQHCLNRTTQNEAERALDPTIRSD